MEAKAYLPVFSAPLSTISAFGTDLEDGDWGPINRGFLPVPHAAVMTGADGSRSDGVLASWRAR